ncbi:MAG: polyprenyl synthetase family protein [Clostridia bacterium]|nr:polyprenyl synthetase family protein [Clostridia bacterium]
MSDTAFLPFLTHEALLALIEEGLGASVPAEEARYAHGRTPAPLAEAMRYSLLAGGKRLRPALLLRTVEMLGGDLAEALAPACALEMIHTYSLIHDDLPGMDDDDLRRGRPTNHKVYGVGIAILAGDGLLNAAYELMLRNALRYPARLGRHVAAIEEIGRRAGGAGMIGGQCMDVLSEGAAGDESLLSYIHLHKTAGLLTAPVVAGGLLCGADAGQLSALERYGRCLGLAFQIVDDLLDEEGDAAAMGKATGADARRHKLTWPALLGASAARTKVDALRQEAAGALRPFGGAAKELLAMADRLTSRKA